MTQEQCRSIMRFLVKAKTAKRINRHEQCELAHSICVEYLLECERT
jgi:hypothetical protein